MSLQPIAVEFCQTSALRGRRRSSIRPQNILPLLTFTGGVPPLTQNESAVDDELIHPDTLPSSATLISPISTAHIPCHSSSFNTSRHHDELSTTKSFTTVSPSSATAVSCESYFEPKNTPSKDTRLKFRLASALFQYFLNGWGDGVTGTALPYFRAEFHLSYMTSSLLFAGTMCGFTLGTLVVHRVVAFLGRFYLSNPKPGFHPLSPFRIALRKSSSREAIGFSPSQARFLVVMLTSVGSPTNFVMMGSQQGFPTMFMGYVIISFARAISTAPLNLFLSEMPSKPLGYAFGVWGLGAVVSPFIFQATAAAGLPWPHFYFGSIVLAAFNMTLLAIAFLPTAQELAADRKKALAQAAAADSRSSIGKNDTDSSDTAGISHPASMTSVVVKSPLRLVASIPAQWAVSLFILFYCGTETTTQGLVVQFLLAQRSSNAHTVGYVSSGFWMGISIARVTWSYFSPRISFTHRKRIIQACLAVALSMQLLIWFIDSTIENGVSVSLIGLFFGPIFPACLELANDLLPMELNMISMAIISATGSMGSAILPFITGVVTTKYSMRCWSYITVAQVTILLCAWSLFPSRQPPRPSIKN